MKKLLATGTLLILCALCLLAGCGRAQENGAAGMPDAALGKSAAFTAAHPSFVTLQELNSCLSQARELNVGLSPEAGKGRENPAAGGRIVSAVVPHHLVAGALIADVVSRLAPQKPERIVLIGPNHSNSGARIITGSYGWQTPYGIVQADTAAVNLLTEKGAAQKDEAVLENEHSIGAIVPFIRYFLPETKVVPIILHHNVRPEEVKTLLQTLEPALDENTVLVSSVDFSHYLTRSEAQAKDRETLRYMRNFDYQALSRLGSDYLDSPASLAAAFLLAQKNGIREFTVLANTNSGIILQNDYIETTSYFTLLFVGADEFFT